MNKLILTIPILTIVFITSCSSVPEITNFEECVAAGNPAMESYPRQCRANDQTFVEEILPEPNLDDDRFSELCGLEPDPGQCEAAMPRYYFDDGCKQFFWGGCHCPGCFITKSLYPSFPASPKGMQWTQCFPVALPGICQPPSTERGRSLVSSPAVGQLLPPGCGDGPLSISLQASG